MKFYTTDVAADAAVSEKDEMFVKVKQGESIRVRPLPALNKSGKTMFKQVLHFKMKAVDEEGKEYGIAPGCLDYHGDGDCPICEAWNVMRKSKDKAEKELTKFPKDIGPTVTVYLPVLVSTMVDGTRTWSKPKLLRLTENAAGVYSAMNARWQVEGIPLANDPVKGQDIIITNPATPGKYTFEPSMAPMPIEECRDDLDKVLAKFTDVMGILDTKIWSRDKLIETMKFSLPKVIDVDAILEEAQK